MRPQIVGVALQKISQDPEISRTMFEILETQNIIDGKAEITLVPRNQKLLGDIIAAQENTVGSRRHEKDAVKNASSRAGNMVHSAGKQGRRWRVLNRLAQGGEFLWPDLHGIQWIAVARRGCSILSCPKVRYASCAASTEMAEP